MIGLSSGLRAALIGLVYSLLLGRIEASASESLARLVPDSAGLCIEIRDLAGSLARAQHGELAKRAEANPVVRAKLAGEIKRASGLRSALVGQLGISADEASRLFGDQLVLAVWAGKSPGESGPGLLILRCLDQPLLARVGRNVAARQRAAGRLDPARPFAAHGQTVEVHTINTGHSDRAGAQVCLAIVGDLAIVATHRELLEETISATWDQPPETSLANLPAYRAAIERVNPAAPLRLFVNPRQWDDQMRARSRPAPGRKALVHDAILELWKATDYVSGSLSAADSLDLEVFLGCQHSRLSPPWRSMAAGTSGASQWVERLPAECVAAVLGRADFGRLLNGLLELPALEQYALRPGNSLQHSAALALAGSLGPDFGLALLAGAAGLDWVLGLETHDVENGRNGPASAEWLVPWLRETLRISAASAQARGEPAVEIDTVEHEGVTLTKFTGAVHLPAMHTLFLTQDQRQLWLGNSAALTAQAAGGAVPAPPANRRFQALHNPRLGEPSDLVLVDLVELRRLVSKLPLKPQTGELADWLSLTGLADAALVEIHCDSAVTAFSLHIACD